jgi:pyridoxine 4-dehydrogenase
VLYQGRDIVPLIGARRREQLDDALRSAELELEAGDLQQIEETVQAAEVAGERYGPPQMEALDSER